MSGLAGLLTGGVIEAVGKIADDLITSDEERAAAALESQKLDMQAIMGVHATNQEEAKHASIFVAGWRPYIGWIAGTALGLVFIPKALALTSLWAYQAWIMVAAWNHIGPMPALPPYPDLGVTELIALIGTLLGMGAMRMKETLEGVARSEPLTKFKLPFGKKAAGAADQEAP